MALSTNPEAVRSRRRWAEKNEESRAYHRAYVARKVKEDPTYLEKRRARARRAAIKRRARVKAIIDAAKGPCVDCGIAYPPEIMDLDHVRGAKEFDMRVASRGVNGYISFARLEAEITKCDSRCPTCHRMRHYLEEHNEANHTWQCGPEGYRPD